MAQSIANWVSDFTGADTNVPQTGDTPNLGTELREVKAVIREESLIKWFESTKIAATYVSGGNTFDVALASLTPSVVAGDVMLLTITGEPSEVWALVVSATDNGANRRITEYTSVTLDADLTHIRRSIFTPPVDPSSGDFDATEDGLVTALPFRFFTIVATLSNTDTTLSGGSVVAVGPAHLPFYNHNERYRVFLTALRTVGSPAAGAYVVKTINKEPGGINVEFNAAPGAGTAITYGITFFFE